MGSGEQPRCRHFPFKSRRWICWEKGLLFYFGDYEKLNKGTYQKKKNEGRNGEDGTQPFKGDKEAD